MTNPECPHCGGVAPSTDGRTECGWCGPDHVPPVVPTFDYDRIFSLIWEEYNDGETDGEGCTELDESLWVTNGDDEDDTHPWEGLMWGCQLETYCTYAQTLETPAEFLTVGRIWITNDEDGKVLAEVDARDFQ